MQFGDCSLHKAASSGHLQTLQALLSFAASINMRNREGFTAIHVAAKNNHLECFQFLVGAGADLNVRGVDNKRVFSYFTKTGMKAAAILSTEFSFEQLQSKNYELWFYLLRYASMLIWNFFLQVKFVVHTLPFRIDNLHQINARVRYYVTKYPELLNAVDLAGRQAYDCASAVNKLELQMLPSTVMLWHNRYVNSRQLCKCVSRRN
jgi:hypothetical protein